MADRIDRKKTSDSITPSRFGENISKTQPVSSRSILTDSPFKMINIMDKRFDRLTEQIESVIEKKLSEYREELLKDLGKKFFMLKSELLQITERVSALEKIADNFLSMQEELASLKKQFKIQENNTVACELRINEVPYQENENLCDIFTSICNSINTPVPALQSVHRSQNFNNKLNTNTKDAVIIVKTCSARDKNSFLKSLANFRKINKTFSFRLSHIGFNSDKRFYVNENLTRLNFQIFRAANRLRKRKLLHSVFTRRGFVYIKKTVDDNICCIDDIKQLDELFPDPTNLGVDDGNRDPLHNAN